MNVIVNINSQKFSLNGVPYLKNFIPHVIGNKLRIVNVYDSKLVIAEFNSVDKFTVNGALYTNIPALQNALLPVLYSRNTLGFTGGSMQELDRIISLGSTELFGNEVIFGTGFSWFLNQEFNSNNIELNRFLPMASEGMYRTHVAYLTDNNDILIQVGEESEEVAQEPNIPPGTLRLRSFNVFGEIVTLGSGPNLPFDMSMLDILEQLDPEGYVWVNINGLDLRLQLQVLIDYLNGGNSDFFDLKALTVPPSNPSLEFNRIYSLADSLNLLMPNGTTIRFQANAFASGTGTVTMPFAAGRMEIIRPVTTLSSGFTSYTFTETDNSRTRRVDGTTNCDFIIPSLVSGNHKYVVVNQSTGVVRVTTAGVYRINGAFDPIVLPQGEYNITRTATLDFVVTLPISNSQDLKELTAEHNLLNQVTLQSIGLVHNVVAGNYEFYFSTSLSSLAASGNIQFGCLGSATITKINGKSYANKQNSFPTTAQINDINIVDATPVTTSSSSINGLVEVTARISFSSAGTFIPSLGFGTAPSTGKASIGSFSLMQKI